MDDLVIEFFTELDIGLDGLLNLDNNLIERSRLVDKDSYSKLLPYIERFKQYGLSSSSLTSLQKNAIDQQKWPILNLLRQILKARGYNLEPKRVSEGYDNEGKKKYKRYFIIKKIV